MKSKRSGKELPFIKIMQVSISSITMSPTHPRGFAQKTCPHPGAFASWLFPGGQGFVGIAPKGRAFVYKRFLLFLKISKSWRLTTLWGLFVALKFYMF